MDTVRNIAKKINIKGSINFNEPMSLHTSFMVGGPADVYITPHNIDDIQIITAYARKHDIPLFSLGKGANILVAEKGIRGIVLDFRELNSITITDGIVTAQAGADISDVSFSAFQSSLTGLEFIYTMPGSAGGAVFMNARCYGKEVSESLRHVTLMLKDGTITTEETSPSDFSYKRSPYQKTKNIIVSVSFSLEKGDKEKIHKEMEFIQKDRIGKGHFRYPCAGSVFKNNRDFGKPSGQIIDELGLKGKMIGGAQVAEYHGNIIINKQGSTARDIRKLVEQIEEEVYKRLGLILEKELLYIGEW